MNKVIVTTTIFEPGEALNKFAAMKDWQLVVVGDKKTPHESYKNRKDLIYVSPEDQEKYDKGLSDLIGWNSIQRRNFGFLWAHDLKADIIATVDDDNIPYDDWGKNLLVNAKVSTTAYITEDDVFDPISPTNHNDIWHRGFPVQLLDKRRELFPMKNQVIVPHIQADFWDGDPDCDQLCRFEHRPECKFESEVFPFFSNVVSPFNSQNTFLSTDVLGHYFMLPNEGRMDDIWASYYVQALGFKVIYNKATVYQQRNPQNETKNMVKEFLGYEKTLSYIQRLKENPEVAKKEFWSERTQSAFRKYQEHYE